MFALHLGSPTATQLNPRVPRLITHIHAEFAEDKSNKGGGKDCTITIDLDIHGIEGGGIHGGSDRAQK